jgi:hypothetical protein
MYFLTIPSWLECTLLFKSNFFSILQDNLKNIHIQFDTTIVQAFN